MTTFVPDIPGPLPAAPRSVSAAMPPADAFGKALDDIGSVLGSAGAAEERFASGSGDLQEAVYERARADVALAVATAAAQRTAQALQAIFTMQV
ncbi:MAG TPA: flagellar hook-basal body complex protein FliE [Candidatus Rubrimentiphilum sp.]|nr:flagellar hook-basal body complex protein FliE [Candidatus Rubrimentiphilum sp.]